MNSNIATEPLRSTQSDATHTRISGDPVYNSIYIPIDHGDCDV